MAPTEYYSARSSLLPTNINYLITLNRWEKEEDRQLQRQHKDSKLITLAVEKDHQNISRLTVVKLNNKKKITTTNNDNLNSIVILL